MGGYFSGRQGGRPTADASRKIDLAWMIRQGLASPGQKRIGSISWNRGGNPSGSIGYEADMRDPDSSTLRLSYCRGEKPHQEDVTQIVRLVWTLPNYGGRRWWMICPYSGDRVGKLYMPPGGDRFAGRKAWRLGYQSQRITARDKATEALFRLQKKLGCEPGWDNCIRRPKGMWHRTYERHWQRYLELDERVSDEMALLASKLMRSLK